MNSRTQDSEVPVDPPTRVVWELLKRRLSGRPTPDPTFPAKERIPLATLGLSLLGTQPGGLSPSTWFTDLI